MTPTLTEYHLIQLLAVMPVIMFTVRGSRPVRVLPMPLAMIRTGELIGRESEGALNLEYFINPWPDTTTSPTNELTGSTGGAMMNDPQQYVNTSTKGGVCRMCHTTVEPYWRDAKDLTSCASGNCHTAGSHATHLTAEYGPHIACDDCHNTNNFPQFSDGGDLDKY